MNINNFKYIVVTGCSYGEMVSSIFHDGESYIEEYDIRLKSELEKLNIKKYSSYTDNIIFINVPIRSQGTTYQSDSIIYITNYLLEIGVLSENIYALVEWSQWSRSSYGVPQALDEILNTKKINKRFYSIGHTSNSDLQILSKTNTPEVDSIKLKFTQELNIKTYQNEGINFPSIEGEYYITPNHTSEKSIGNILGSEWEYFINELQEIDYKKSIDEKIKDYFNNIIKTQSFFKLNNIRYNFFHMQSCMSGWYYEEELIKHNITHNLNYINRVDLIKVSQENDIEAMWPKYRYLFNQIDFNNIYQYNKGDYRRGGLDEYSYSKYGETSYTHLYQRTYDSINGNDDQSLIHKPFFGNHPATIVYKTLWNDITTNCDFFKYTNEYLHFIDSKIFEDINYNGITKNGLFISREKYKDFMKTCKS